MNDDGYNWAHRELHYVAQNARSIHQHLFDLNRLGVTCEELRTPSYWRVAPSFILQHGQHHLYVVDEYEREWPCKCGGDHTGECPAVMSAR